MGQDNSKNRIQYDVLTSWDEKGHIPTPEFNNDGIKSESEIKQQIAIEELSNLRIIKKIEFWYGVIATLIIIGIILTIIFASI
jgi:hypothetical protein